MTDPILSALETLADVSYRHRYRDTDGMIPVEYCQSASSYEVGSVEQSNYDALSDAEDAEGGYFDTLRDAVGESGLPLAEFGNGNGIVWEEDLIRAIAYDPEAVRAASALMGVDSILHGADWQEDEETTLHDACVWWVETMDALENYPLINEDHHSEITSEREAEAFEQCGRYACDSIFRHMVGGEDVEDLDPLLDFIRDRETVWDSRLICGEAYCDDHTWIDDQTAVSRACDSWDWQEGKRVPLAPHAMSLDVGQFFESLIAQPECVKTSSGWVLRLEDLSHALVLHCEKRGQFEQWYAQFVQRDSVTPDHPAQVVAFK